MGLNWSKGFKGAAQGTALMMRTSENKTNMLYKQVSDANMMRFREKQHDLAVKGQADTAQYRSDTLAETTRSRKATEAQTEATRKSTEAFRNEQLAQGDTRNVIAQQNADTSADRAVTSAQIAATKPYTERIGDIQSEMSKNMILSDEEKAAMQAEIKDLQGKSQQAHEEAGLTGDQLNRYRKLSNKGIEHALAFQYAGFDDEERKKIDSLVKKFEKAGKDKETAIRSSINIYKAEHGDVFIPPEQPAAAAPEPAAQTPAPTAVEEPAVVAQTPAPAAAPEMIPKGTPQVTRRGQSFTPTSTAPSAQAKDKGEFIAKRSKEIAKEKGWLGRLNNISHKNRIAAEKLAMQEWIAMQESGKPQQASPPTAMESQYAQLGK